MNPLFSLSCWLFRTDDVRASRMRAFLDVAEVHQFDYLHAAVEEVLYS